MKYRFRFVMLLALCVGGPLRAETMRLECPPSIQLVSSTVAPVPGWEAVDAPGSRHALENAQIYAGHPRAEMALVPNVDSDGQSNQARWQFERGDQDFWIACSYRDTPVTLAKQLARGVSNCVIRYRRPAGTRPARPQSISCS